MTLRPRPTLDRLEFLLQRHRGDCGDAVLDCDGCDLAAEVAALHRLRQALIRELDRHERESAEDSDAAPPVVFLGPDVIALVHAARAVGYSGCDADAYVAMMDALKPFEGVE